MKNFLALCIIFLPSNIFAEPLGGIFQGRQRLVVREFDLFPSSYPTTIEFPNGSISVSDGTTSIRLALQADDTHYVKLATGVISSSMTTILDSTNTFTASQIFKSSITMDNVTTSSVTLRVQGGVVEIEKSTLTVNGKVFIGDPQRYQNAKATGALLNVVSDPSGSTLDDDVDALAYFGTNGVGGGNASIIIDAGGGQSSFAYMEFWTNGVKQSRIGHLVASPQSKEVGKFVIAPAVGSTWFSINEDSNNNPFARIGKKTEGQVVVTSEHRFEVLDGSVAIIGADSHLLVGGSIITGSTDGVSVAKIHGSTPTGFQGLMFLISTGSTKQFEVGTASVGVFVNFRIVDASMTISGNNPIFEVIEGTGIFRAIVVTTGTFGNLIAHDTFTALSISSFNSVVYISSRVVIQSTQNYNAALIIGNGVDAPTVASGVSPSLYISNNGTTQLELRDSVNNTQAIFQAGSQAVQFGAGTQTPMAIVTANLERMRVSGTGNIGFGNTNPQTLMHMTATVDPTFIFNDSNDGVSGISAIAGGVNDYVIFGATSPHGVVMISSNITRIAISSGGMVVVGGSTPTAKFEILNTTSSRNFTNEAFSFKVSTTTNWPHLSVSSNGYINFASSSPSHALSSCGTGPTIYGGGSAFTVTPGGGAPTGCTITFGVPFQRPPVPIITSRSGVGPVYTLTETALTLTLAGIGVTDVVLIGADR